MFLIAVLSYTLISQLGITTSDSCKYCLQLYDETYERGSYIEVYKSVGSLSPPWTAGSVCVPFVNDTKRERPYWYLFDNVNYTGRITGLGHGTCIDDFTKSGFKGISSIKRCIQTKDGKVECINQPKRRRTYCRF
uniref:IL4_i_Ig domain-containing protein n=1 Tax=Schistosoma mansoni TaxID=6183 RepID=A0A5K4F8A9_SCHMA